VAIQPSASKLSPLSQISPPLIEGHGVDPDIVVDNLPHDTFAGSDAQLKAALDLLKEEIRSDPRPVPPPPPYPNKAFSFKQ
jgi:tricorn protease